MFKVQEQVVLFLLNNVMNHQELSLSLSVSGKICLKRMTFGVYETKAIKEKNLCYISYVLDILVSKQLINELVSHKYLLKMVLRT